MITMSDKDSALGSSSAASVNKTASAKKAPRANTSGGEERPVKVKRKNTRKAENPPLQSHWIKEPLPTDVLFGRGKPIQIHPGNRRLHAIVDCFKNRYYYSSRRIKSSIGRIVIDLIKQGSSARFLMQIQDHEDFWTEVPDEEARDKISHTFRNKVRVMRQEGLLVDDVNKFPREDPLSPNDPEFKAAERIAKATLTEILGQAAQRKGAVVEAPKASSSLPFVGVKQQHSPSKTSESPMLSAHPETGGGIHHRANIPPDTAALLHHRHLLMHRGGLHHHPPHSHAGSSSALGDPAQHLAAYAAGSSSLAAMHHNLKALDALLVAGGGAGMAAAAANPYALYGASSLFHHHHPQALSSSSSMLLSEAAQLDERIHRLRLLQALRDPTLAAASAQPQQHHQISPHLLHRPLGGGGGSASDGKDGTTTNEGDAKQAPPSV